MTAIIHVPGVSRVAGAPHISDLPFPRANVRSWISGNGYILDPDTDKIQSLVDRENADLEYPTISTLGALGFVAGTQNRINILRSVIEAYPSETGTPGYGAAVPELSGKVSFIFLVKWGSDPDPGTGASRADLLTIRSVGSSQPMLTVRMQINRDIQLVARRLQVDTASIVGVPYQGPLSDYSLIIAEVDYFANTMSLEVDGSKVASVLSSQTGEAPVMPEGAGFEVGGNASQPFRGALSDMVWFEGAVGSKAKDKVKSYLTAKQAALNES